jgi:hypothetical protein
MVTATLVQLGPTVARPAGLVVQVGARRPVGRVVGLVLVVVTVRAWAGVWPAAVLGAVVGTVGLLAAWAAVERRETERVRGWWSSTGPGTPGAGPRAAPGASRVATALLRLPHRLPWSGAAGPETTLTRAAALVR